jgi:excisionase family DNA binding protein
MAGSSASESGKKFLTADEVAALCRVKRTTVYRWARRQLLPAHRVGHHWLFPAHALEQHLAGPPFTRPPTHQEAVTHHATDVPARVP